ncbi:MAG: diaminopimelate decarboxylase [Jiangellales bacterium]
MRAHPAGPLHADLLPEQGPGLPPAHPAVLATHVWPIGTRREPSGVVSLHGRPLTDLADEHGTPAFFLDEADFRARARAFRSAFDGCVIYYAAKAFLSRAVARWVHEEGLFIDVCSGGELRVALDAGFPVENIALHGNNKSLGELEMAVQSQVGLVVVDSFDEIDALAEVAAAHGRVQPVLLRVRVGVEAHTHEFIATAHEDVKFGFSRSAGDALAAVRATLGRPSLQLRGLHSHIGSQIFDTAGFEVAAARMVELLVQVRDELGVELPELDLGGGLGIAYVDADDPQPLDQLATRLLDIVARECERAGLAVPQVAVEPGRALVGPAMLTAYRVGTVKNVDGIRTYVSVDGGMSDNIRTALYDADYTVTLANRTPREPLMLTRVVGKHCESGDVVVRDAWLPSDTRPGDLLAVAATGAYCRSMASNYNMVERPPVVVVDEAGSRVIVRRESMDDLLACDLG